MQDLSAGLRPRSAERGIDIGRSRSQIIPIIPRRQRRARGPPRADLQAEGFDVRAIRPPAVPPGTARLARFCECESDEASLERFAQRRTTSDAMFRGLFITGTDTDVGKTTVAAALMHRYREFRALKYWKPVQTGIES